MKQFWLILWTIRVNPPSLAARTDLFLLFPGVEDVHVGGEGNVLQHNQTVGQRYPSQYQIDWITSGEIKGTLVLGEKCKRKLQNNAFNEQISRQWVLYLHLIIDVYKSLEVYHSKYKKSLQLTDRVFSFDSFLFSLAYNDDL